MAEKLMSDEQVKTLAADMKEAAKKEVFAEVERDFKEKNVIPEALRGMFPSVQKFAGQPDPESKEGLQLQLGRYVRAVGALKMRGDNMNNRNILDQVKAFESQCQTSHGQAMIRSLGDSTLADGGAFITQGIAEGFIELLTAKTVVRATAGVETISMPTGTERFRRETSGTTASWGPAGGTAITASQPAYGEYVMLAKNLQSLVPVQNAWLKRADAGADKLVVNRMITDMAVAEDLGFIRGVGNQYQPLGIYGQTSTANYFDANATVNIANISADATNAMQLVYGNNVPYSNPVWWMSPRTYFYLLGLKTANSVDAWPELKEMMWFGAPVKITSSILNTYGTYVAGAGTDSEVYFGEASKIVIGDTQNIDVKFIEDAAYVDSSGNTIAGASTLESVFRVVESTDILLRYPLAFAVIRKVAWHV